MAVIGIRPPGGQASVRAKPSQFSSIAGGNRRRLMRSTGHDPGVIYRMRIYQAVEACLPSFHEFFREWLLPVQLRHGARLVGRWETEDCRVVAVWEYDDRDAYERIEAAVRADPDSRAAQVRRLTLPELFVSQEEVFMTSTLTGPHE